MVVRLAAVGLAVVITFGWGASPVATLVPGSEENAPPPADAPLAIQEVREQLDRRAAWERDLGRQVARLAVTVETLRGERNDKRAAIAAALEETRRLEVEMDRIVPRMLARRAMARQGRQRSARALAALAGISRQAELDPGVRARLLAVSPLMLERLSDAGDSLAALEGRGARLTARHRELSEITPGLLAAHARAEMDRARAVRRHAAVIAQHGSVAAELERLAAAEARLARGLLVDARQRAVRLDLVMPRPTGRANEGLGGKSVTVPRATVTVAASPSLGFQGAATKESVVVSRLEASLLGPPPAKPPRAPLREIDRARIAELPTPVDAVVARMSQPAKVEGAALRAKARPILPSPDALLDPALQVVDSRPVITIPARFGQPVAAPDDGRAVFAGEFGDYGLLLILEHEREYHTLLWGFASLGVASGDLVESGQIVGRMGEAGADLELHVEFRRNGRPVGALPWLAASSSKVRG